jgi:hypothetical protein
MKTLVMRLLKRVSSAQTNESELAQHPHRIRFWGNDPGHLAFPPLCPNCGAAATARLAYSKVFHQEHAYLAKGYITTVVKVPYCDACIARHHTEAPPPRTLIDLLMRLRAAAQPLWVVAFAGSAIAAGYGGILLLPRIQPLAISLLLLSLLLAAVTFGCYRSAQEGCEYLHASPQGGITTAFDFSDGAEMTDESARFLCTIRNERFAQEFANLNFDHIYRRPDGSLGP